MSIELYEEIRALKERMAVLEARMEGTLLLIRSKQLRGDIESLLPARKKPGPPKGYKRKLPAEWTA